MNLARHCPIPMKNSTRRFSAHCFGPSPWSSKMETTKRSWPSTVLSSKSLRANSDCKPYHRSSPKRLQILPYRCDPCYNPPCYTCNKQEMSVKGGAGLLVSIALTVDLGRDCKLDTSTRRRTPRRRPGRAVLRVALLVSSQ